MPIELKMPALSPTMEEGTLAKWLVEEGSKVTSGTVLAEIETDKATMEYEAIDEGVIARILVAQGTDEVKVGTVIAILAEEGEDVSAAGTASSPAPAPAPPQQDAGETGAGQPATPAPTPGVKGYGANPAEDQQVAQAQPDSPPAVAGGAEQPKGSTRSEGSGGKAAEGGGGSSSSASNRVEASPLARRLAEQQGIDLAALTGSGPGGRIVKADVDAAAGKPQAPKAAASAAPAQAAPAPAPAAAPISTDIPHEAVKLSNMRKTIARRLTEAKQTIPHIYLTVDIRLDALLKLRGELNQGLESRGVKLSVNDMLIKALAVALVEVPECNVSFTPDQLIMYSRADISVAVSIPGGLITPIIVDAGNKSLSAISREMLDLAGRAKEGKLQPQEYQGGTASLSNMGMFGISNFQAVINPPQGMIMAIGAGAKRPHVIDDSLQIATIMSATGSFDHRAIDGADGARLMKRFKELVEAPLGMIA